MHFLRIGKYQIALVATIFRNCLEIKAIKIIFKNDGQVLTIIATNPPKQFTRQTKSL